MDNARSFMMTAFRKARHYARKLWVRVVLIGLLAVLAVALSQWVELYVPDTLSRSLDGAAADRLLQLIASAMLAVTIFSITVMVSVYQSSSTQWTPRVHRLIMQDKTTQNTLAVFIGAYVYALLGIILRELGVRKMIYLSDTQPTRVAGLDGYGMTIEGWRRLNELEPQIGLQLTTLTELYVRSNFLRELPLEAGRRDLCLQSKC